MAMKNRGSNLASKIRNLGTMKEFQQAKAGLIKSGYYEDPQVLSSLLTVSSFSQFGCLDYAQAIFLDTRMDNVYHCNIMIRAFAKSLFPLRGVHVYNRMRRVGVSVDNFTYTFVLQACAAAIKGLESEDERRGIGDKGVELHGSVFKSGFGYDHFIQNLVIHVYAKCGAVCLARKVFDEMSDRTVNTWNIMISAYDQVGEFGLADELLGLMPVRNVVSWNTLLGRYVRLCDIVAAKRVFEEMPVRDSVSWNTMIAGYVQVKDYDRALAVFREMVDANVDATEVTLISILGACAETGALHVGREIHQELKKRQSRIEGYLGNALVDMYAKSGNMSFAWEVFNDLKMKHVTCWNTMIVGLAVHGYSDETLKLFGTMETCGNEVTPNRITFMGVLTACSHKGLVEEGRGFFSRMTSKYNIQPDMKHYGCMVDLLSRSGLLNEAFHTIQKASLHTKSALWRTLLGSCRIHNNVELAEECFSNLSQSSESPTDGDYVLLSNIYAEAGRWHDVQRVRNGMINSNVAKKSGFSNIND